MVKKAGIARLHEDDVGHRQERRDARDDLGANARAVGSQLEDTLEHATAG
jgi:hypothetical protein